MLSALRARWPWPGRRRAPVEVSRLPAPASVEVSARHLVLGEGYAATFAVVGYPAEVGPAWLEPLLAWPGRADIALHVDPLAPAAAAATLRRQRARLESARRLDAMKGRLADPTTDAAADDATDLADRVARGAARLFRLGIYLTVHARSRDDLAESCTQVKAVAASLLLDLVPVTWRQLQGWCSTLPLACDSLRMRRILDTAALAAAFPLASPDLPGPLPGQPAPPGGVLYGVNTASSGIVWWDRFAQDNYNAIVLARSGAGKSYQIKLETLRWLEQGATAAIVDPDGEYRALAGAVGGTYIDLGEPGTRVNPFDIPPGETRRQGLTLRYQFAHTVLAVLLGHDLSPEEAAALERALPAAYEKAGITHDPRTWTRPGPLLRDITTLLDHDTDPHAGRLAAQLAPWTTGSFKSLVDGPTTLAPASHLVVWGLRHLPDEQRRLGTLLALDAIWRDVDTAHPGSSAVEGVPGAGRRLVVVDEAWTLLQNPKGARFLYQMAKAARKRNTGLTVVTQDIGDVLSTELGRAVISNSATQILLRQAPQAIDALRDAFALTDGETRLLLTADRGEGLLLAGTNRVAYRAVASPAEHRLCLTSPEFLTCIDDEPDHQQPTAVPRQRPR